MKNIDILDKDDFIITRKLLYGDLSLDDVTNTFFLTSKTEYILATKRFHVLPFNPCDKLMYITTVRLFYFHFYSVLFSLDFDFCFLLLYVLIYFFTPRYANSFYVYVKIY